MGGLRLLQKHGVEYNILTTVNRLNADHPLEVYRFLRDEAGATWMQFIPAIERINEQGVFLFQEGTIVSDRSVLPEQLGNFLITIFDEWVRRDVGRVFVQTFEATVRNWMGLSSSGMCVFDATCGHGLAVEHNGDLYSCDHFVEPKHLLGNILRTHMIELVGLPQQQKFGRDKMETLPRCCRECEVRFACQGECPKNRFLVTPDGEPGMNYLCAAYKAFFHHIDRSMKIIAALLRRGYPAAQVMQVLAGEDGESAKAFAKAGRNDPCPCGSGRKFKKCHGLEETGNFGKFLATRRAALIASRIGRHGAGHAGKTLNQGPWRDDQQSNYTLKGGFMPTDKKPNILVIWGDDIGYWNISAYSHGMMGYRTPNIDRIAGEGIMFTDCYGEQSCTAGRSAFITGQSVFRTGLSKVGMPGADLGLRAEDPTIAELLKPLGYATGQFGKNHLGDKDEFLPTKHGFDEFFGFLYHLNACEEPELRDYPPEEDFPNFKKNYGPRGVLRCSADGRIEDTGQLTKKRMETIDDEVLAAATEYIDRQVKADKPFFVWFNTSHMHFRTHAKPESLGQSGRWQSEYHDVMIDHDKCVGELLKQLDDLGIADNTIVMYSTDNGPHMNSWPDGGMTPFRNEKDSNWEGAFRVPSMVRWPGVIKPGTVSNEIISHLDWSPTLLAVAGEPDIKEKLLKGHKAGEKTFKVHLDGYNLLPYLMGEVKKSPRVEYFYFSDDGDLMAVRYDNWKMHFMEQRMQGTLRIWQEPLVPLRFPKLYNLRTDPFERADITSNTYWDWVLDHVYLFLPAQKGGRVSEDVQGVPAASEGGELYHRSGVAKAPGRRR